MSHSVALVRHVRDRPDEAQDPFSGPPAFLAVRLADGLTAALS